MLTSQNFLCRFVTSKYILNKYKCLLIYLPIIKKFELYVALIDIVRKILLILFITSSIFEISLLKCT